MKFQDGAADVQYSRTLFRPCLIYSDLGSLDTSELVAKSRTAGDAIVSMPVHWRRPPVISVQLQIADFYRLRRARIRNPTHFQTLSANLKLTHSSS